MSSKKYKKYLADPSIPVPKSSAWRRNKEGRQLYHTHTCNILCDPIHSSIHGDPSVVIQFLKTSYVSLNSHYSYVSCTNIIQCSFFRKSNNCSF